VQRKRRAKSSYKILMIAPTMFFADYGCHVRILEEAVALEKMGHHVTILAYPNGRDIAGLEVKRSWGVPFNYRVIVGSSRHKIYLDLTLALAALSYVLRHDTDIIHAHLHEGALIGWFASKVSGAPLVFDVQGSMTSEMLDHNFLPNRQSLSYKLFRKLEELIDRISPILVTSSQHLSTVLQQDFSISPQKIFASPDCVNVDAFSPDIISRAEKAALKSALGIPEGSRLIVYLGILAEYQGIDLLLNALSILNRKQQNWHILLMGYPREEYYRAKAVELNIAEKITITGKINYEQAPQYLSLGDVAVAPKISDTEGSGKILNYMSVGLPTVAFKTPVSTEYLGNSGIYAEGITAEELAAALERALSLSAAENKALGERLRERIKSLYSWEKAAQQLSRIYHAISQGKMPQPAANKTAATILSERRNKRT
jgi:glycosyltransferase involved in cell wall biosynthesis